ncbi:MAG TPA: Gldg family protein [Wenzhouxiangellaceae bacterium]|nr:Gldg family protein [Wenzhouxiangellaceae bacterium]
MKNIYSSSALAVLAVLFIVLTMLSSIVFKGWRLDLTENNLYTLSEGTVNIAESLDQKIRLRLYFSDSASEDLPQIRSYAERVWELMQELAAQSDGMIELERIDPEPFSEAEDAAARYGLEAVPLNQAGDVLYLGVVGTNAVDGLEVLPFLSPNRESLLEYDLARMVSTLSSPDLPRVGLITGLQLSGGFDMQTGQRTPSWAVYDQWSELFDLTTIEAGATELPPDLDALVVVHPKNLSEDLMFSVDQFVLGGGRLLAFVDPYAEADPGDNPNDPASRFTAERSSTLAPLFGAWGIEMDAEQFVADLGRALQVTVQQGQPPVRHPAILGLTGADLSDRDIVTGDLNTVNVASAGALENLDGSNGPTVEWLMRSSERSGLLATERLRMAADPSALIDEIGLDDRRYSLAARLTGEAETAFPDRLDGAGRSRGLINAIVVADTDLLSDNMWVQRQSFLGSVILNPFADNGALAVNALENLLGNADLISIRSRSTSTRTFDLVEDLRRRAEARLRETEQRLEAELRETENRLTRLQQGRGDSDMSILTTEQEAEIDRFMEQRLEIRQQLRQVRRELDKEIEALGTRVKIINIMLVPLLVTIVALFVAWRRRRQQHGASKP